MHVGQNAFQDLWRCSADNITPVHRREDFHHAGSWFSEMVVMVSHISKGRQEKLLNGEI